MKEFYKAMIKKFYLKISMLAFIAAFAAMPAAAERNQSAAVSKEIKFTSPADLNLNLYHS